MSLKILLDATTRTDTELFAAQAKSETLPCTFQITGAGAAETIDIQRSSDGGTTWEDVYVDGTQQQLSDTNTDVSIYGPGTYRALKAGITTSEVWVSYSRNP